MSHGIVHIRARILARRHCGIRYHCDMAPLIQVQGLHIRFGAADAVRGIDFRIDEAHIPASESL
jgi:hypothetical protein